MKTVVYCWHGDSVERQAVEQAGFEHNQCYDEDPFEVAKKIHACGNVYVAISPMKELEGRGEHHIVAVSDDWFKQR